MWIKTVRRFDGKEILINTAHIVQMDPVENGKYTAIWQHGSQSSFNVEMSWGDMVEFFESQSEDDNPTDIECYDSGEFYK